MLRPLAFIAASILTLGLLAESAEARNRGNVTNYYGTPRGVSARTYSGIYQAQRPNRVRTFTLPGVRGGGYYAPYGGYGYGGYGYGGYGYGHRGYYQQPVIIYPPRVIRGYGF